CNGNLRWMKSFGSTTPPYTNAGWYLATDTLGGVYILGGAGSNSPGSGSVYWDTDTTLNIAGGNRVLYLIKYDSQGQLQWLRTLIDSNQPINVNNSLSVGPSGEVFWFSLLDAGTYSGGAFTVTTRKYYAVNYDAAGVY